MSFFSPYQQFPRMQLLHWILVAVVVIACVVASIRPLEMNDYILHQIGTVLCMSILLFLQWRRCVSISGFVQTIIFILLHVLGAHYLYSYVPYNEWIYQIFHVDLNQYFGWSRNMYDRFIHFCYGLLLFKISYDIFTAWLPHVKPSKIALLAIQFIMATSLIYELLEWWIAIGLSPETAENYNGQQGDIWDAQKDMALAIIGALCAAVIQRINLLFK